MLDCSFVNFLDQESPWRQKTDGWLPGAGGRGWEVTTSWGTGFAFGVGETVLDLDRGDGCAL